MPATWTAPKTYTAVILTFAELNTYQRDNMLFLKIHQALGAANALVISGGSITVTQGYHKISGEGAAADDLDTIAGGTEGDLLYLRADGEVITLKDGTDNLVLGGDIILATDNDHIVLMCDDAGNWHPLFRTIEMTFLANVFQFPDTTNDWAPSAHGAALPATRAGVYCWLPLNFLKIGDVITGYRLTGDITETTLVTLDCKLVRVNLADPITTTDITNGGMTQQDADGDFDVAVDNDDETVITDSMYNLEILGTTGVADAITVMGAEVTVQRLI